MANTITCTRRGCGAVLATITDQLGRVTFECPPCARNRAGTCRDCPRATGSARLMRCDPCREAHRLEIQRAQDKRRWADPDNHKRLLARIRERNARPHVRERRRLEAAEYRKRHPYDEWDRRVARARQRELRKDPAFRAAENARKRAWRRRRKRLMAAA